MEKWQGWDKIRYESELDHHFADEIASIPGGDKLFRCIQCGTCSGMCPLSSYMDYTPRQIVAMIRAGFRGEVLSSYTTWLCASCYACTVECPQEIKITEIMYAAKRLAIRGGMHPKRFPSQVLATEFFRGVERKGRSNEGPLLVRLFLRTNPFKMFGNTGLGLGLFRRGRLSPKLESIKRTGELHTMLAAIEQERMVRRTETTEATA
ncbi:MAG TPA: 4Fe-4S dicluster domain-containing protein [candidate division Zixibacteria bacterium]|nr:4Fe-4S dicluster domain-containing protein [candidate division Zixibacteria bacterium]MDD4916664.1 4Fe-4S dicluster domain-containing protein [candidate division Zixibacteria bacterium]MDM7973222.1 4Fe-4S dicluster domain-containing protein [candidate division Zixibacteria bacterium]HOD66014.1 4Fe-4S dicluster domain-containing protein [candidate division Zixibacteria bacterium]HOZ08272.1 4Fe-4S dicluster domain-containing protein [candidate division Zixibacteria bacterium]